MVSHDIDDMHQGGGWGQYGRRCFIKSPLKNLHLVCTQGTDDALHEV